MRWLVAVQLVATLSLATAGDAQLRPGTPAPDIELRTLGDAPFRLSALKGRPVILTFWGTWCPPCRQEFPELVSLWKRHHEGGLEIVAVNQRDQELSTKDVQQFVDEFSVPFIVVLDPRGRSRRTYRLMGLPTTVFVDRAGLITHMVAGPISEEQFARGLTTLELAR